MKHGTYTRIEDLGLSVRTYNSLKRNAVDTLEQAANLTDDEVRGLRGLSSKGLAELHDKILENGAIPNFVKDEVKVYRVWAASTTYCYTDVVARSEAEAETLAEDIDGGDFIASEDEGNWEIINVEERDY